nr:MAG TPA: hypothetical protein [Caudoviricetes sp.]
MDGAVCGTGDGFFVRVYSPKLEYKVKRVTRYKTDNRHVTKYHIAGHRGTIILSRTREDYIVTYNGKQQGCIRYPHDYDKIAMVCAAATNMFGTPVVLDNQDKPTLF